LIHLIVDIGLKLCKPSPGNIENKKRRAQNVHAVLAANSAIED